MFLNRPSWISFHAQQFPKVVLSTFILNIAIRVNYSLSRIRFPSVTRFFCRLFFGPDLLPPVLHGLREVVLPLLLLALGLVEGEALLDLLQRAALDLHAHAQVALVLLAVDVVQEVDRVLHHAVAHVAVVAAGGARGAVLRDHHALAKLGVEVDLEKNKMENELVTL